MSDEQLSTILALAHELSRVECKRSEPLTNRPFMARIVRAILGMSNRRDGGVVIVGVEETPTGLSPRGVESQHLATWNYDYLSDQVARYADPYASFTLSVEEHNNANYVLIEVSEFADIPVLCKSQYDDPRGRTILRKGALYVRSRSKPATTEVASQTEMREVIALGIEKGLRDFLTTARRADISLATAEDTSNIEKYRTQLAGWDE
jgi:predicted HTH transcriptional regulator